MFTDAFKFKCVSESEGLSVVKSVRVWMRGIVTGISVLVSVLLSSICVNEIHPLHVVWTVVYGNIWLECCSILRECEWVLVCVLLLAL